MQKRKKVLKYKKVSIHIMVWLMKLILSPKTDEKPGQFHDPNPRPPTPPGGSLEAIQADVLMFSFQDLVDATENFSSQYIIGNGGFGVVYKASIRSHGPFAIKKIHKVPKCCL